MATLPWSQVAASDGFKALPPDQQEQARQQYFSQVVAPRVPKEQLDNVRQQFDSDTKPQSSNLLGAAELAGAGVGNIIPSVLNAGIDMGSRALGYGPNKPIPTFGVGQAGQDLVQKIRNALPGTANGLDISDAELRQADPTGKVPIEQLRRQYAPESQKSTVQMLKDTGTVLGDTVGNGLEVGGDVAQLAPILGRVGRALDAGSAAQDALPLWRQRGFKSPTDAAAYAAGFRNGDGQSIAMAGAGEQARMILTNNNLDVGNVIARHAAGLPHDPNIPLNLDTLPAARAPAEAVYERVAQGLPTGPLDEQARVAVARAVSDTRITNGSPDVAKATTALRDQLIDPNGQFTGQQVLGELRNLRREGFAGLSSDDPDKISLGRAQLSMADAIEGHMERNITPSSGTSLDQFREARKAIAQNLTVGEALKGEDLDLAKLGRMYANAPDRFSGGLKLAAQFAEKNGAVVGRRITHDDMALRVQAAGRLNVLEPGTYIRAARVTGIPQRSLVGSGGAQRAQMMFPGRPANTFDPLPMRLQMSPGTTRQPSQLSLGDMSQGRPPSPPLLSETPGASYEQYQPELFEHPGASTP